MGAVASLDTSQDYDFAVVERLVVKHLSGAEGGRLVEKHKEAIEGIALGPGNSSISDTGERGIHTYINRYFFLHFCQITIQPVLHICTFNSCCYMCTCIGVSIVVSKDNWILDVPMFWNGI